MTENPPEAPRPDDGRVHLFALKFTYRDLLTGEVLWEDEGELRPLPGFRLNRLFNEGEKMAGELLFRQQTYGSLGVAFFGRLTATSPSDDSTLAAIAAGEPASNGYQPLPWSRNTSDFGAPTQVGGQYEWAGGKKTFTASGAGYGPVGYFFFATTSDNAGIPVAYAPLSEPRVVTPSGGLDVTPRAFIRGVTT